MTATFGVVADDPTSGTVTVPSVVGADPGPTGATAPDFPDFDVGFAFIFECAFAGAVVAESEPRATELDVEVAFADVLTRGEPLEHAAATTVTNATPITATPLRAPEPLIARSVRHFRRLRSPRLAGRNFDISLG